MTTNITSKGQVTIPKAVREQAGLKLGDKVVVQATPTGVHIGKPNAHTDYLERIRAIAKRGLIDDSMTTDEFMEWSRGEVPQMKPRRKK